MTSLNQESINTKFLYESLLSLALPASHPLSLSLSLPGEIAIVRATAAVSVVLVLPLPPLVPALPPLAAHMHAHEEFDILRKR